MENLVIPSQLSYYKDKRIFITGHTGFKGSWLTACLYLAGAKIKGYSLAPEYEGGLYQLIRPFFEEDVIADIRDKVRLAEEIKNFQPDFIFHLAAQPLVRRSYQIPSETFEVNVIGTSNLLESIISFDQMCTVLIVTTDKVYENKENGTLYSEDDQLGGYDPYSASKACAELVVSSFRNSFFNPDQYEIHRKAIVSVRAGNVIGGGDWSEDRIIPDIVKALISKEYVNVRNPNAVRPWQHVLEPLSGYLLLSTLIDSQYQKYSKVFNFGPEPDDHLTVEELVDTAIKIWGNGSWRDVSNKNEPHEANLLKLNIERAKKELNWYPKLRAKTGVEWTINWYKTIPAERLDYTLKQIKQYFAL